MDSSATVAVVGSGYAGVLAAKRITWKAGSRARVRLVTDQETFVERIRLHERIARGRVVRLTLASILGDAPVEVVRAHVEGIDASARALLLADGERLAYDRLVVAAGSATVAPEVPGVLEHATLLNPGTADALHERITRLATAPEGGRIVVCGGGLTGIETATEIAEAHPTLHVTLATGGDVGEMVSARGRAYLRRALPGLGVTLREGFRIARVEEDAVLGAGGERLPADVVIWAGGFGASPLLARAGFAVNARGQALLDPFLRPVGHEHVWVAGDAGTPVLDPGNAVVMGCKTALPSAAQVADNVAASLRGRPQTPYDFKDSVLCISLGRRDALLQFIDTRTGRPADRILTGRPAALVKEQICRLTVRVPRRAGGRVTATWWLRTGRAPAALPPEALAPLAARPGTAA